MKIKTQNTIKITLKGKDINVFTSILDKVLNEDKSIGFNKKVFTNVESELLSNIKENL